MADIGKSDVERHELWAEVPGVALIIVGACAMLFGIILYIVGYIMRATPQGTIWILAEIVLLVGLSIIAVGLVVRRIVLVRRRVAKIR